MESLIEKKLMNLASKVREEIKREDYNLIYPEEFKEFPLGSCGAASEILQRRLITNGYYDAVIKANNWFNDRSHAWVECQGYIVDITADQFVEMNMPPIVVVKKEESSFHKRFEYRP